MIEVHRSRLMALVQTDSELGDILMRALILRRLEISARGRDIGFQGRTGDEHHRLD